MKKLILIALVTLAGLSSLGPVQARGGFGAGFLGGLVGGTVGSAFLGGGFGRYGYSPYYSYGYSPYYYGGFYY